MIEIEFSINRPVVASFGGSSARREAVVTTMITLSVPADRAARIGLSTSDDKASMYASLFGGAA